MKSGVPTQMTKTKKKTRTESLRKHRQWIQTRQTQQQALSRYYFDIDGGV
jgi:hypothetical protein